MPVRIRLSRKGCKKRPFYRIVVVDSRKSRNSSYLDCVGTYNNIDKPAQVSIDGEKVAAWLKKGAQPSQTVQQLLNKEPKTTELNQ